MPYRAHAPLADVQREARPFVFTGALSLACVAGFVNVVVLGVFHVPVSHMSGAVSRLGIDLAAGDLSDLRTVAGIVGAFLVGAAFSGAVIGGRAVRPGRRYGLILGVEGAVFAAATLLLGARDERGVLLAALGCGMQNAMASSYLGLVIRTTHVTGIVTDLGVMLGHWIRRRPVHPWRAALLLGILTGFFGGGLGGAWAYRRAGIASLAWSSVACIVAGAAYFLWVHARRERVPQPPATG